MDSRFPEYRPTAKLGKLGVSIVSRIVAENFGWLFKRNHQEHDFGTDGQIGAEGPRFEDDKLLYRS